MIYSLAVVAPLLCGLHNGQELLIVSVVVLLSTCAFSTLNVEQFENLKTVILVEYAGYGKAACIGLQNTRLCQVEMVQNLCFGEGSFQLLNRKFGIPSPIQFQMFRRSGCLCFL